MMEGNKELQTESPVYVRDTEPHQVGLAQAGVLAPVGNAGLIRRPAGGHTLSSAAKRLILLLTEAGVLTTLSMLACAADDWVVGIFDRKYGVKTSGFIAVEDTSFDASKVHLATGYAPVNAWALRRLFRTLSLPKTLRFADLGCGLGRACIIAAEYGFSHVTGVDLASEFCGAARQNISRYRQTAPAAPPIRILRADALDYCDQADDDVFFMFRPFTYDFTCRVLRRLADQADQQRKTFTVIYTEKLMMGRNYAAAFGADQRYRLLREQVIFGQSFHVHQCGI